MYLGTPPTTHTGSQLSCYSITQCSHSLLHQHPPSSTILPQHPPSSSTIHHPQPQLYGWDRTHWVLSISIGQHCLTTKRVTKASKRNNSIVFVRKGNFHSGIEDWSLTMKGWPPCTVYPDYLDYISPYTRSVKTSSAWSATLGDTNWARLIIQLGPSKTQTQTFK